MPFLIASSKLRIFEVKDMMELVIYVVNGMGYKRYFLENIHMHIMCTALLISNNYH
jgi:hypothetical protein